jgi:hypothetical protein
MEHKQIYEFYKPLVAACGRCKKNWQQPMQILENGSSSVRYN